MRLAAVCAEHDDLPVAILDRAGTIGGRGAYVCRDRGEQRPNDECLGRATARGVLQRAFRRAVNVSPELLESESR
jgi:predicted RNA-binding protein YlxR (DUF448 family)